MIEDYVYSCWVFLALHSLSANSALETRAKESVLSFRMFWYVLRMKLKQRAGGLLIRTAGTQDLAIWVWHDSGLPISGPTARLCKTSWKILSMPRSFKNCKFQWPLLSLAVERTDVAHSPLSYAQRCRTDPTWLGSQYPLKTAWSVKYKRSILLARSRKVSSSVYHNCLPSHSFQRRSILPREAILEDRCTWSSPSLSKTSNYNQDV